jgi:hypothetical protein
MTALTELAWKDHARDLPVMNGVREDIKGVMALRQGNFDHKEALSALTTRVEDFEVSVYIFLLMPFIKPNGY